MNKQSLVVRPEIGLAVLVLMLLSGFATPAQAQARTWVSQSIGDDRNPCSRLAPCQTFAGALAKTAAGGEINVLDPGGYGSVTINKSVIIDGGGTFASILASGSTGIDVNAGANDFVILRNLTLNGGGTGVDGVVFFKAASLHIENCRIENFRAGWGIRYEPVGGLVSTLHVSDTTIIENGSINSGVGGGIRIVPAGSTFLHAKLQHVRIENNREGVFVDAGNTFPGDYMHLMVQDSVSVRNSTNGFNFNLATGKAQSLVMLDGTTSASNFGAGVRVSGDGNSGGVLMSNSTVALNRGTGVQMLSGGTAFSYLTNRINGNLPGNGTPLPVLPASPGNPGPLN